MGTLWSFDVLQGSANDVIARLQEFGIGPPGLDRVGACRYVNLGYGTVIIISAAADIGMSIAFSRNSVVPGSL